VKTLGIVGGIGPESTIEYYRAVVATWQARRRDGTYPLVVINSIDLNKLIAMIATNELSQVADYLAFEVARLASAGADCALLAANTPHLVFDDVQNRSAIKLVSIVQATCDAAERMD
jgi:aspartate racemase